MAYEISYQLNENDRNQVIHLLASSFPVDYKKGLEQFEFFIERYPEKCYLLARDKDELIIGVICLLKRKMNYNGLSLDVTGCSYMAVHPEHRNFSVSAELRERMFSFQAANSDISLGFARRAMDNYWYQFGFTGFTNFGTVLVEISRLPSGNKLVVRDLEKNDIPTVASLYEQTYTNTLDALFRTPDMWHYLIDKLARNQQKIETIRNGEGEIVGYFFRVQNTIEELCIDESYIRDVACLIRSIILENEPGAKEVNLKIGINHPFSKYIRIRLPHSVNTRFAWNGGHIIRINTLASFFKKITPVLEDRLLLADIGAFDFKLQDVLFSFDKQYLHIEVPEMTVASENRQRHFWQKLVFGVQDVADLIENKQTDNSVLIITRIMFPLKNPQVPLIDQF
jgi:predicted acetyltransferase